MMWGYSGMNGLNWFWMAPMMLLIAGGLIAVVVLATRAFSSPKAIDDVAIDTLRKRFAAGEINQDEFNNSKRLLG